VFERLGSLAYRFRFIIVLAWLVAGGLMAAFAPSLVGTGATDQTSFLPPDAPSVQARDALERAFPGSTSASSATVTVERTGGLTAADLAYRDELVTWVTSPAAPTELREAVTGTATADSRPELVSMLRSPDGTLELVVIDLDVAAAGDQAAVVVGQLREHLLATTPAGLQTHVTGAAAISSDYLDAVKAGTASTTAVTIVLLVLVLLAIYRAPLAAMVPLVTIGAALLVSRGLLGFLAAAGWQVSSIIDTFLVVLVFGVGTDYAIFLISRYREEVTGGDDWHAAARTTVRRIGAVISASAATVIVGMTAMAAGDFKMITTTGPALALAIAVTLAAGLTLTPALLSIFGHYLYWPRHTRQSSDGEPGGFFARLAAAVSRRPGLVTVGLLVALLIPSLYIPKVQTNFDVLAELPKDADSRLGYEAIATHLGQDKLVQTTALLDAGGGVDLLAPAQLAKLRDLMVALHATPGIATTTSLVTPEGDTTVPDGLRPSKTLASMADGFSGGGASSGDSASLTGPEVTDGLDRALAYVNGLAVAYPDVAAGSELAAARSGLQDALDLVGRAQRASVLSTQLRTLSATLTSPANAAAASGGQGAGSSVMSDYLAELAVAYPEVVSLDAYRDGVSAAKALQTHASISAALDLANALDRLAGHFDGRPDATFSPKSLSGTESAKALKAEAQRIFDALPGKLTALSTAFAARPDDIYLPTALTGEDGQKLRDAIDAFVSGDRTATRFYITSISDPYSGGAFGTVKSARTVVSDAASAFGPSAAGYIGGPTAQFVDVQDTLASDFVRVGVITVIGIVLVLMLLLRAVVAPIYLVATVLVSYGSAIGVSAFLFQEVLGQPGISFYLPLMVFVLLVALGSDYNIFLMHRVREESEQRPIRDGVRIASGHTGAVITSAGLILAGTFGSMATAQLIVLFQVGVAVAIGVLIDTFVVRSILVPAITTLVGDRAWWPSGGALAAALGRVPLAPAGAGAGTMMARTEAMTSGTGEEALAATGPTAWWRPRARLVVAAGLVILVPALVAGLLTWSFSSQDLGAVRGAVVDLDTGGSVPSAGGATQSLTLGSDLTATLTAPGGGSGFTWVETDESVASAGLADGTYAAVLTIPADFSRRVAAIRTDPTGSAAKAVLQVTTNDGSGYTLGTVARAVTEAIGTSTAERVTASYVDDVLVRMTTAHDAFASAATDARTVADDGSSLADDAAGTGAVAGQVTTGLRELAAGARQATSGTDELVSGTRTLATGSEAVASGAKQLATGTKKAASGADSLSAGAAALSAGATELERQTAGLPGQTRDLATGAAGVATGAKGVADGAADLSTGLDTMRTGTTGMGAGARALDAGAAALESGAGDLAAGARQTASGAASLATGAGDLAAGVHDYTDGVTALAAGCAALGGPDPLCAQLAALAAQGPALAAGAADVATGAAGLKSATAQLATGARDVESGAAGVRDGTHAMAGDLPTLERGIADAATGAAGLATGAAGVADGAGQVAAGTEALAAGTPALSEGVASLAAGAEKLASGEATYATGMDRLAAGASTLASGAAEAATGARALADGTATAAGGIDKLGDAVRQATDAAALVEAQVKGIADDGSALADRADALAQGLGDSASGTAAYPEETRTRLGDLAADPVVVDATRVNAVGGPEGGLAPYFMAIAAWLGALGAFLILPAVWPHDGRRGLGALRSYGTAAAVSVAGSLLMVAGMLVLGVHAANVAQLVVFGVLAALAFTAVVQALVASFGTRGWLAALLLLVVGIAASGIALEAAAAPGPLALLRPLVPLSYAIDAFRGAIAGAGSAPAVDAAVLAAWLLAGILGVLAATVAADHHAPREHGAAAPA
jgi:RND superfamily putative drug exporter